MPLLGTAEALRRKSAGPAQVGLLLRRQDAVGVSGTAGARSRRGTGAHGRAGVGHVKVAGGSTSTSLGEQRLKAVGLGEVASGVIAKSGVEVRLTDDQVGIGARFHLAGVSTPQHTMVAGIGHVHVRHAAGGAERNAAAAGEKNSRPSIRLGELEV